MLEHGKTKECIPRGQTHYGLAVGISLCPKSLIHHFPGADSAPHLRPAKPHHLRNWIMDDQTTATENWFWEPVQLG